MTTHNHSQTKVHGLIGRINNVKIVSVKEYRFASAECPACHFEGRMQVDGSEDVAICKAKTFVLKHVLAEHKSLVFTPLMPEKMSATPGI